ncbi:hypothetical protein OH460_07490 [Vibrio sp. Makdt]|uniref:hypothetical protein n=1 Tax=Vibrio sp. Makdt TaxID=2998828 RepID=UPI0022CD4667|nr:hypothetical protein [Vibrio sp. Makdt]MDA0152140.1 hypothetical protein [Vibrio sp. Makdt]
MLKKNALIVTVVLSTIVPSAYANINIEKDLHILANQQVLLDSSDQPLAIIGTEETLMIDDEIPATGIQNAEIAVGHSALQAYRFIDIQTKVEVTIQPGQVDTLTFELPKSGGKLMLAAIPVGSALPNTTDYTVTIDKLNHRNPAWKIEKQPNYGELQYQSLDSTWKAFIPNKEYDLVDEIRYIPNKQLVEDGARDVAIGSFDSNPATYIFDGKSSVAHWGASFGDKRIYSTTGLEIQTYMKDYDTLTAYNGPGTAEGAGIGGTKTDGLNPNDKLVVKILGDNLNQVIWGLDGLGGCYVKGSSCESEVRVSAYRTDGTLIQTQGDFRDALSPEGGEAFRDEYIFTFNEPVDRFELWQTGNGSYVAQNATISRTLQESIQLTRINADNSQQVRSVDLNLRYADSSNTIDIDKLLGANE